MPTISYPFQIDYAYDEDGNLLPRLALAISRLRKPTPAIDVDAYLDSGAERTLLSGWIGSSLGLDILSGPQIGYESTVGTVLTATIHPVRLAHAELGNFELEVGFASVNIKRNLLGRDFFNLTQIGFRERHRMFYVATEPCSRQGTLQPTKRSDAKLGCPTADSRKPSSRPRWTRRSSGAWRGDVELRELEEEPIYPRFDPGLPGQARRRSEVGHQLGRGQDRAVQPSKRQRGGL